MKLNKQILQINRNFAICFVVAAAVSATVADLLSGYENYLNTTITVATGYVSFFGIFAVLFYFDNKNRYKKMESSLIRKEIIKMTFSFGVGELVYLVVRWVTLYYFLEINIEAYLASLISSVIAAAVNMIVISVFLKKIKTF
jgi:glucose-6-phosphate-specific signal transduction histidine kinase